MRKSRRIIPSDSAIGIIDRGRASQKTRGFPFQILTEIGFPPFNTLFLF